MVKHDPPNSYGDCVRACIASLLSMPAEHVPHFYHDNCEGVEGNQRLKEFLQTVGYAPFWVAYDGASRLDEIQRIMTLNAPSVHYMLFHANSGGDHVIICKDDQIVHDPAWYRLPITGPNSIGNWGVLVLVKS